MMTLLRALTTLLAPLAAYFLDLWNSWITGWNRFWFAPADPTTLGAVRICTGLVLLFAHLTAAIYALDYIGPNAWIDVQGMQQIYEINSNLYDYWSDGERFEVDAWAGAHSIWFAVQDPVLVQVTYWAFLLAGLCFTLGLCTRVTSVLVWLGHIGYIHRAFVIFFGMDTILALLTLYLMIGYVFAPLEGWSDRRRAYRTSDLILGLLFGPAGGALSLDCLIARFLETRQAMRARARVLPDSGPRPYVAANLAIRLIQIHLCITYLFAGLSKLQGASWWSGAAIWLTLNTSEFAPFDMSWLGRYQWLANTVSIGGVAFTLFFEIGFTFLIWSRKLRPLMLFLALGFHAGIGFLMGLGSFQSAMLTADLAFVAPATLRWIMEVLLKRPGGFRFVYDRKDESQIRAASWIHAADVWKQVELVEAHDKDSPAPPGSLITREGAVTRGVDAARRLLALSATWFLWPIIAWTLVRVRREELSPVGAKG